MKKVIGFQKEKKTGTNDGALSVIFEFLWRLCVVFHELRVLKILIKWRCGISIRLFWDDKFVVNVYSIFIKVISHIKTQTTCLKKIFMRISCFTDFFPNSVFFTWPFNFTFLHFFCTKIVKNSQAIENMFHFYLHAYQYMCIYYN